MCGPMQIRWDEDAGTAGGATQGQIPTEHAPQTNPQPLPVRPFASNFSSPPDIYKAVQYDQQVGADSHLTGPPR